MKNRFTIFAFSLLCLIGKSIASGQNLVGQALASPCAACHGSNGQSLNPAWPHLAGQEPSYLKKQLQDLKLGNTRVVDAQMRAFILELTDEDIENLARFYSSKPKPPGSYRLRTKSKLGEDLYIKGNAEKNIIPCITCHGEHGQGSGIPGFPSLKGQQIDYTIQQLKAFKTGMRKNDLSLTMPRITEQMSEEEIIALAKYLASF